MKTLKVEDAWDIYSPTLILDSRRPIVNYCLAYIQREHKLPIELSTDKLFIYFENVSLTKINKYLNALLTAYNAFSEKDKDAKLLSLFGQIERHNQRLICINNNIQLIETTQVDPISITRAIMLSKNLVLL